MDSQVAAREKLKNERELRKLIAAANRGAYLSGFVRNRPSLFLVQLFTLVTIAFTGILMLPICSSDGKWTSFSASFFTTTSAISGTGLTVLPSTSHWSFIGQLVLLVVIQIGGLGIMTMASMIAYIVSHRIGLTTKILAVSDTKTSRMGHLGSLMRVIFTTMLISELVITLLLLKRFLELHETFHEGLWNAIFFAVSSFNNAGFNIAPVPFSALSGHWGVVLPVLLSIFLGGIGFPVISNIFSAIKEWDFSIINLHSKIVLITIGVMSTLITVWYFIFEWNNHALFDEAIINDDSSHISALTFAALTTQTSGFSVIDASHLSGPSIMLSQIFMFIGGAPASTCSGIKVTTLAVLLLAVFAEFRGSSEISIFRKRFSAGALRIAVTIFVCGVAIVIFFSILLDIITNAPFEVVQFDVISAFANCGLSLGLTNYLNTQGMVVMGILMLVGRLGTMTIVSAMLKENRTQFLRYPEENIIIA